MFNAPPPRISGLYLISRETENTEYLLNTTAAAIAGGARAIQYRDKSGDRLRRHSQAQALADLCRSQRALLVINDDVALASAVAADGVHLGEHDAEVADARSCLGATRIIGVSCYDQFERAERAVAEGADYIAFGAFFPSATKPLARRASPELLSDARALRLPVVAIGGIDASNGAALIDAGADALAVLAAVWDASDIAAAARAISSLFQT